MSKDLALAYHNLSLMLDAGMPIVKSLNTIELSSKPSLRYIFSDIAKAVSEGQSLSEAIDKHPKVFAPLDLTLIKAADISGKLPESFMLLSRWHEFCKHLRNIITSGLMLPLVLIHVTAILGPLPPLLLDQIGLPRYISEAIGILVLFYLPAIGIYIFIHLISDTGKIRKFFDHLILRIPLLGQAVRQLALTRYCRAFNMLYKAGIPITQSAQQAAGLTGNAAMADLLKGGTESAQAGNMVCEGFSNKLPPEFLNLWRIGEETGELDNAVKHLADNTGEKADTLLLEFSRWLPRLIYAIISIIIIIQILRGAAAIGARITTQL